MKPGKGRGGRTDPDRSSAAPNVQLVGPRPRGLRPCLRLLSSGEDPDGGGGSENVGATRSVAGVSKPRSPEPEHSFIGQSRRNRWGSGRKKSLGCGGRRMKTRWTTRMGGGRGKKGELGRPSSSGDHRLGKPTQGARRAVQKPKPRRTEPG